MSTTVSPNGLLQRPGCPLGPTKRAIALEKLTHIRTRARARRSQRATLHSWSFAQLQAFIVYKAALAGVPVHRVNPRNTSRTCPACGHIDKANRKTQSSFVCTSCGFAGLADVIAAENIRVLGRALVSAPYVSETAGLSRQSPAWARVPGGVISSPYDRLRRQDRALEPRAMVSAPGARMAQNS